ncbi:hypothetical protein EIB71_10325 [Kaistella daneshvariae]|uniref:Curli assembly protein CsgC n=1 Tax=Kaistella daneshvariae TaxID=2487074 RepID=A0ABM7CAJ6_9FLAO|nr:curli-like amyloid fiber formation chaperone CsgH [Kaistella daneshvariae]AZI68038.1 hypothetical protein EIB71_10325 [Kaistella daneshvariae]
MKTLIAILLMVSLSNITSAQKKHVDAKILTENHEGMLKIRAVGTNSSDLFLNLNYILISLKKGKAGMSTNKQSGKFSLKPNETRTLSETNLNLQKDDGLKVFLLVKDEESDKLVAKDSLEINSSNFNSEVNYIPESALELEGLTVDETRTRVGQMFYEFFFKKYNQLPKKFSGTITVAEFPTLGRSTRISVSMDDQMVYIFNATPDEEAINAEAEKALANLVAYISNNSLRDKEFKY